VPLNHPGRDRTSGRIWRIVYTGADGKAPPPKAPRADWTKATVEELIGDLSHPNLTVRMTATHELVERGQPAIAAVKALLKPGTPATPRAHALWVLERLGALDDAALDDAATTGDMMVRLHALRILAERKEQPRIVYRMVRNHLLSSSDGLVRRVAADVLARHPSQASLDALLELRAEPETQNDPFLLHTVRMALREQFRGRERWGGVGEKDVLFVADAVLGLPEPGAADFLAGHLPYLDDKQRRRMPEYVHHVARYGSPDSGTNLLNYFVTQIANGKDDFRFTEALVLAILRGSQERGRPLPPFYSDWVLAHCPKMLESAKPGDVQAAIELAAAIRVPALQGNLVRVLIDRQHPEKVRTAALTALASFDLKQSVGTLALRLADATEAVTFREKVAQALAGVNAPPARDALLAALPAAPARLATAIAASLAGSPDGAAALLQAAAESKASPRLLLERPVQVKLDALKRPDLAERVAKLTAGLPPADAALAALLRKRADAYAKAKPDAAAGAKLYTQHCAACHQIGGVGAKVGPQLDGIGARGLERLLEDVLDPNRNVDQSFRATALVLKNGQALTGLVLREEGEVIVLADAQGKEQRVEKAAVDQREVSPLSPMPANWAEQIPEKDFYDLMAYLLSQRSK
jgi:putative heme-binding domain-containing protein